MHRKTMKAGTDTERAKLKMGGREGVIILYRVGEVRSSLRGDI